MLVSVCLGGGKSSCVLLDNFSLCDTKMSWSLTDCECECEWGLFGGGAESLGSPAGDS